MEENIINTNLHPIDVSDANAELEKNEIVINPDNLSLHKVLGKSHSKGGTPLNLNEGAFIFSDYKKLAFNKDDIELMEFKKGGSFGKKKNYTPAKVLEREIEGGLKHHNKMINIVSNPLDYDDIAKVSAQLMLQKNLEKVGRVAYMQEAKKRFKDGVPEFSRGTAPVYSHEVDKQLKQANQYNKKINAPKMDLKYDPNSDIYYPRHRTMLWQQGGRLPKYQDGSWYDMWKDNLIGYNPNFFSGINLMKPAPKGIFIGEERPGFFKQAVDSYNTLMGWDLGTDLNKNNISAMQNTLYNTFPNEINTIYNSDKPSIRYNNKSPKFAPDTFKDNLFYHDAPQISYIKGTSLEDIQQKAKLMGLDSVPNSNNFVKGATIFRPLVQPDIKLNSPTPEAMSALLSTLPSAIGVKTPGTSPDPSKGNEPGSVDLSKQGVQDKVKLGLTPLQMINIGIPLIRGLSVKTYYPIRQHQESVYSTPQLMSAQPQLNQANQAYFNSLDSLKTMTNPSQLGAISQNLNAQRLDHSDRILGNMENQNVNLINQARQNIANMLNQDAGMNRQYDQDYYNKLVTALQNRDDNREYYENQALTTANKYIAQNQAFNSWINSQKPVKTNIPIYDDKGNITGYKYQNPYLLDKNFFGYTTRYNPNIDMQSAMNSSDYTPQQTDYLQKQLADVQKREDAENAINPTTEAEQKIKAANLLRLSNEKINLLKFLYGRKS